MLSRHINYFTGFIEVIVHTYLHPSFQQMVFLLSPESSPPSPGRTCVISLELVPSRSALKIEVAAWCPGVGRIVG